MSGLIKVARIREEGVPAGIPARLFFKCPCGARPEAPTTFTIGEEPLTRCECGTLYDVEGYIIKGESPSIRLV